MFDIKNIYYLRHDPTTTFLAIEVIPTSESIIGIDEFTKNPKNAIIKIESEKLLQMIANDSVIEDACRFSAYTILSIYRSVLEQRFLEKEMMDCLPN